MRMTLSRVLFCTALAAPQAGCVIASDDDYVALPEPGSLTVTYTIEGKAGTRLCDYYNISSAELVVYTQSRRFLTERNQPCSSFFVAVNLNDGVYYADLTLVDSLDRARSVTKPLTDIRIVSGADLVIDVDFPADSLF